jgi:[glutamine synthetase] adenylyltransferase / [glutamine synthetase]-adenylyl-L-tyrosine phosphorylase
MSALTVLDAPELQRAFDRAADPAAARSGIERILDAHPALADDLATNERLRDALVALTCASRSLTAAVVNDVALLHDLDDEASLERERSAVDYAASLAATADDDRRRRLRRWKRSEYLRIAVRDLLSIADLPSVGRELSALAEVCLAEAVAIAEPSAPFAVIGMGKLGGAELNYASDVDVLFVHDGDSTEATHAARAVLDVLRTPTADGIVFRVDADLRPEGAAGMLSRNLDGYRAWYERWARPWEFQALIKARAVAGTNTLGEAFVDLAHSFVWSPDLDAETVREARAMKARAEAELARRGLSLRELKRGPGGIRDIEFAIQLLQLVHGRQDPSIRSRTTLTALEEMTAGGYVERLDVDRLAAAYVFLRTVEHRLQLWDDQQTHTLPDEPPALTRVARVMGYRDVGNMSAVDAFQEEHRTHQGAVRSIHERLFFAPILDTLVGAGALPPEAAEERLRAFGFVDAAHTRAALEELTRGLGRSSRVMKQLLPVILDWLSAAPDPDLGLLQLRKLVEGTTRSATLAATFRDKPGSAERACRVLGSSRVIGDALRHEPEVVELFGDDEWLGRERHSEELTGSAMETLQWRADVAARRAGLRRFKRRELLRIAAADIVGVAQLAATALNLSSLADACVEAALAAVAPELPFAVIGMGRLGGRELSYASDIDVLFVYDGESAADFARAVRVAEALMGEIGATTAEGQTFRIDAKLRPEGSQGPLARSLDGYWRYYDEWALPWERQSLLRARTVAGDRELGDRFLALVEPFVFRDPLAPSDAREIRRVKARMERGRIPPREDPQFHLKLGKGGLTDVEFTVQLLQLEHGAAHPEVRTPGTTDGLERLRNAGLLSDDDATALLEAYRCCERARNACYLVKGAPTDALPSGIDALRVARLLGYTHRPEAELRDEYRRVTRRARRVVERVFYGN